MASFSEPVEIEEISVDLVLRESPWDPYTELLHPCENRWACQLVRSAHKSRDITNAGPLEFFF